VNAQKMAFEEFLVADEHTCMADAMNIYFGAMLFSSGEDFYRRQRELIKKQKGAYLKPFHTGLMSMVFHAGNRWKRVNDFISTNVTMGDWPTEIKTSGNLAIVDYYASKRECMHVEACKVQGGRLVILKSPESVTLPFTDLTLEQYLAEVAAKPEVYQMNIFHYVRHK
jgi:hypothetical protein